MSHTEETNHPITEALHKLLEKYEPADSLPSSDEQWSTAQIAEYLGEMFTEDDIDYSLINQIMIANGYQYQFADGFRWLLRIKTP
jgi:hypothetical protein